MSHVLIVGAGAIGAFYGAILKRAGWRVSVVLRSEYQVVAEHGFTFTHSPLGDLSWRPDGVYRDGDVLTDVADYVVLTSKVLDDLDRGALLRPWLASHSRIVLIQNGLDIERAVAEALPQHELISAIAFVGVSRTAPGELVHNSYGHLSLGCYPSGISDSVTALAQALEQGGIAAKAVDNVVRERWLKSVWNAPFNPLSVLGNGADTVQMLDAPGAESLVRALMAEVLAVASAEGHDFPPSLIDAQIAGTRKMPGYRNSMALDYLAGRPIELQAILGNIVDIAARHQLAVPHLQTVLTALRIRQWPAAQPV